MSDEEKITPPEDEQLDFNINLRRRLVDGLITDSTGNENLPVDKDSINSIVKLLGANDSSIIQQKRLKTDEVAAENDRVLAGMLDELMDKMPTSKRDGDVDTRSKGPDLDESKLPSFKVPEGTTSGVGDNVDLDEIDRRCSESLRNG